MYVRMSVFVYVCMSVFVYVRMSVFVYVSMSVFLCMHECICVCMHECIYVCTHECICVRTHAYVENVCMYARMGICMESIVVLGRVCCVYGCKDMNVNMYMSLCISHIYIYISYVCTHELMSIHRVLRLCGHVRIYHVLYAHMYTYIYIHVPA